MTHTELRQQIQDIIQSLTKKEFTKPIIIKDLEPEGYAIGFEVHQYAPYWISATLPDEAFMKYIREELRRAKFLQNDFMEATRYTTQHYTNNFKSKWQH